MTDEQTPAQLTGLDHDTTTTGWRDPDAIRQTVRRRRRTAFGTAGTVLVAAGVVVALTVPGGGTAQQPVVAVPGTHVGTRVDGALQLVSNARPIAKPDQSAASTVATSEQALTLRLLQHLGGGTDNTSVSALSLYEALGMLQNGAGGTTQKQIAQVLSGLSTSAQNAGLATLTAELTKAAGASHITLQNANSVWQQSRFAVRARFLATLAQFFDNGVWQTDFAHNPQQATAAINAWVKAHTHGKIPKLFDSLDPSTVLVLANALYFHAAWAQPFQPSDTEPGTFTTGSGKRVSVKYMSGVPLKSASTGGYLAVQLPYSGGRFAALAIMPKSGTLAQFVKALTSARLDRIAGDVAAAKAQTAIGVPKFTTSSALDLVPTLKALGMTDAFDGHADLTGINATEPLAVDQVVQRVYVAVGEKGTTAAAATGVAVATMALADPPPNLDHPFLFLVRDTKTGAILFATAVNDPSAG